MRTRRRVLSAIVAALMMVSVNASAASAYTRTWTYSGSFRASLTSTSFANTAAGTIKITVHGTNCSVDYPYLYLELRVQQTIGWSTVGSRRTVYCAGASVPVSFTWSNSRVGTYRMFFYRSGPPGLDENWKRVNGTVYYW